MNKQLIATSVMLGIFLLFSSKGQAQCREFAKDVGLKQLDTALYIHDGRFNAIKLREGDEIELFKTISAGINYRVVVCGSDELTYVPFEVLDFDRNVLYTNADNDYKQTWDFPAESSQRLIIAIKLPPAKDASSDPKSGCVSILFGLKREPKK